MPVLGIENRLSHREMRAGFDFGFKAAEFFVNIFRDRIDGYADGEIGGAAEIFPAQSVP